MIEQVISDIKGVLYNDVDGGKEVREGAIDFIKYLRENPIPFMLGTNVTSEMPEDILADLNKLGFELSIGDVTSCVDLSADYLRSWGLNRVFLISDNEKLRKFYEDYGLTVVDYRSEERADAIVVALDRGLYCDKEFGEEVKAKAIKEIEKGVQLVALHRNMTRVDKNGKKQPNVGQVVKELEEATGYKDTVTIGKPSKSFYTEAMRRLLSQDPTVTLMIGDDPIGDLSGAHALGMPTAFVRSAKYSKWPKEMEFRPSYEVNNVGELVGKI